MRISRFIKLLSDQFFTNKEMQNSEYFEIVQYDDDDKPDKTHKQSKKDKQADSSDSQTER
jgi:hypothetical protein|tara:strand:- start:474 stop:653 length:180 start_codon:yes stop_codon:yes gene_type:complete